VVAGADALDRGGRRQQVRGIKAPRIFPPRTRVAIAQ
jgi:hypothetical protein